MSVFKPNKINPQFALKSYVWIHNLKLRGKVIALYVDAAGISYKIRYFINSEPKDVYFDEDEIEVYQNQEEKSLGFSRNGVNV